MVGWPIPGGHTGLMDQHAQTLQPSAALRSAYHLACVRGADLGLVIALKDGLILGRSTVPELVDRSVSRCHFRVVLVASKNRGRIGYLEALSRDSSGRKRVPLRVGGTFRFGSGLWQVRARPPLLKWVPPKRRFSPAKLLRFIPLLLLLWWVARLVPGGTTFWMVAATATSLSIGFALFLYGRRRNHYDGAYLSLAWLAGRQGSSPPGGAPGSALVWAGPWGSNRLELHPGQTVGVLGESARVSARWIAVQVALQIPDANIYLADAEILGGENSLVVLPAQESKLGNPSAATEITVAWGSSIEDLPPESTTLVCARAPVGSGWLEHLGESSDPGGSLPSSIDLADLGVGISAEETLSRWKNFSYSWAVPVGIDSEGQPFRLDIPSMGPHALIAGATGSGKTVALQTWLWSLIIHVPPTSLRLILVDYKGGSGLDHLRVAPHTELVSSDLDAANTAWILRRLSDVVTQRKVKLKKSGFADIRDWERAAAKREAAPAPPRILVVIDEFQVLYEHHPKLLGIFTRLSAQGRSLGLHLLLATQRPGHAVNPDLRGTIDLRVGMRFTEAADSLATLGHPAAASLPKIPGRAICGEQTLQFARLSNPPLPAVKGRLPDGWPTPLPQVLLPSTLPTGLSVGVAEGDAHNTALQPIGWNGSPLLLTGPTSVAAELRSYAQWLATQAADHLDVPLHSIGPLLASSPSGPRTLGQVALLLTLLSTAGPGVLVVEDLAGLAAEFEFHNLALEFQQVWQRAVQQSSHAGIRIVAVDCLGSAATRPFDTFLAKIPSFNALQDPSILRTIGSLPRLDVNAPDESGLTEDESITAKPGRFVSLGLHELGRDELPGNRLPHTLIQLPTEIPPPDVLPVSLVSPWPASNSSKWAWRSGVDLAKGTPPPDPLLALGIPAEAAQWLKEEGVDLTVLQDSQWMQLIGQRDGWISLEPPLELLRALSSTHSRWSLWLRASYPFPPGCGIYFNGTELLPLCLKA